MEVWQIILLIAGILGGLAVLVLLISFVCFLKVFYSVNPKDDGTEKYDMPPGEIYEPYHEQMRAWRKEAYAMPCESVEITSFDGLKLHGKYYEQEKGGRVEILLHGYRGTAERDLCGGIQRCFALKRNVLIVNQRASRGSEGHVISFGINESKDCLAWIDYIIDRFGKDVKIFLGGISMGAATVLTAAGMRLPKNVVGAVADCGFSSAKEIICSEIKKMGLPPKLLYPFVKLGARLYGRFDLEETSPLQAIKNCKIPVVFIHGETDDFVPCEMSKAVYEACPTQKFLWLVPNAGHGLAYLVDPDGYIQTLKAFEDACGI